MRLRVRLTSVHCALFVLNRAGIVAGMIFLHKHKKVAHLDIKSHNILMDQDRPKIGNRFLLAEPVVLLPTCIATAQPIIRALVSHAFADFLYACYCSRLWVDCRDCAVVTHDSDRAVGKLWDAVRKSRRILLRSP